MRTELVVAVVLLAVLTMGGTAGGSWYKGDIHYHQVTPDPVGGTIPLLQRLGYEFVILEYKDLRQPEVPEGSLTAPGFLVIHGRERSFLSRAGKNAHLSIAPQYGPFPGEFSIPAGFDRIRAEAPRALTRINHPSDGRWTLEDIGDAVQRGARIFELTPIGERGGEFAIKLWDDALAHGMLVYASLASDVHALTSIGRYGWDLVRAPALTQSAILDALRSGDFVAVEEGCTARITNVIRGAGKPGSRYRVVTGGAVAVRFIGRGGQELARVKPKAGSASYVIRGDEVYVRAEIADPAGRRIFTQPVMVSDAAGARPAAASEPAAPGTTSRQ